MARLEHYMYVLECADGSLYTGYTTDVQARIAAHNSGSGAKYTAPRRPVSLRAFARFYTKQRAMSAEYRFKRLDRAQKDAMLGMVDGNPAAFPRGLLEDALPGFGEEPVGEAALRMLAENADEGYRGFLCTIVPGVDPETIVGVRMPQLRSIAARLAERGDEALFMENLPHALFEENQLHAVLLGGIADCEKALAGIGAFLPFVDNWATCDAIRCKALMDKPAASLEKIREWILDPRTYVARFGLEALMLHFLDDRFRPEFLDWAALRYTEGDYYLNMMRAWFFAEGMAKHPREATAYLEQPGCLDEWTRRVAIRKACESRRVAEADKARLRAARTRP